MAAEPRVRKSAGERREEILSVAVRHFAIGGLHGTSTEAIAREAGISQPYLFRLFRTKKELFIACVDRANERVRDAFRRAVAEAGDEDRLKAMGHAYIDELLPDILEGTIEPGRVFDRTVGLDGVPGGYRARADRESIKVLVRP